MILRNSQCAASLPSFLFGDPLLVLFQGDTTGHHVNCVTKTIIPQYGFNLLCGRYHRFGFAEAMFGKPTHEELTDSLAGEYIGYILLVQGMVSMYDGGTGLAGDIAGKLIAEKFTLAVDHIRLPVNQFLNEPVVMKGDRHTNIRVYKSQRQGLYMVDITILVTFQVF